MTFRLEKLRGSEVLERLQATREHYLALPFMRGDDFVDSLLSREPYEATNQYLLAFDGDLPVGVLKYYVDLPGKKTHLNEFLASQGLPQVEGRMFHGSYVGVHPGYRRQGIGTMLNNRLAEELKPGDVFVFSSHEPDGAKLNASWFSRMGGGINVIFAKNYLDYESYDPTKKNFVVSDPSNFRSLQRIVARHLAAQ